MNKGATFGSDIVMVIGKVAVETVYWTYFPSLGRGGFVSSSVRMLCRLTHPTLAQ